MGGRKEGGGREGGRKEGRKEGMRGKEEVRKGGREE